MKIKDTAICLRAVNYSETSQVVTLLTRDNGKIAAMAKGSRRAKSTFDGAIEVFSFGQAMFTEPAVHDQLCTLTEFVQMPRFRMLRANLSAMNAGLFAVELTESFCQPYDPHPDLFDALCGGLETLQQSDDPTTVLIGLVQYQLTLLLHVGIMPRLNACANCGSAAQGLRGELYFSSAANGLLCGGCEQSFSEKRRISIACMKALAKGHLPPDTPPSVVWEAEQLLIYHFTELMHRPPRTAKLFMSR